MKDNCIFCKIVKGELPAVKVYEDEHCLAFMDINPVTKGHTLVIPKEHYDPIINTPTETLRSIITVVKKVAKGQSSGLGADGISVTQANGPLAGQLVPHIHFHIIPRCSSDPQARNWIPGKYADQNEMERYAEKIRNACQEAKE